MLLPLAMLLLLGLGLGYAARDALRPTLAVEVVPAVVRDVTVEQRSGGGGGVVVQAPGWVEPEPYATRVAALRDGIVAEVLAMEGEQLEAGQVVARLVDDDARIALTRAEADVAQAEAKLQAAQLALGASTSTAQPPATGSALAELEAELAIVPTWVAGHEAKVAELQAKLAPRRRAMERELVSPVQVELLEARLRAAEADLDGARQQEAVLRARLDRRRSELQSELLIARARRQVAEAAHEQAALAMTRSDVISPVSGVVLSRQIEPGSSVRAGDPEGATVLRLYDPARLQVRVDVPQAQAGRIGVGQEAQVVVDVLPEQVFEGRVTRVLHEADLGRNTLQFKVTIDEPSPQLKPQMTARVRFLAPGQDGDAQQQRGTQRLFAPMRVVGEQAGETRDVWLANQHGRAERRRITLGELHQGAWIEVRSGLNPGDRLIVDPPTDLQQSQRLSLREATFNSGAGAGGNR
ncbi:efflux RND transporter periplasmic adaptor subunit [Phycisphaerales bacterium AB-hyl4]|uniref:Efflux RND transporter periplasmic adaptor subunit n=1 Tax=Natronomicrosphaera hydrolytica TaxID=3242702 RepID=A0ABV4U3I2_9BACT